MLGQIPRDGKRLLGTVERDQKIFNSSLVYLLEPLGVFERGGYWAT